MLHKVEIITEQAAFRVFYVIKELCDPMCRVNIHKKKKKNTNLLSLLLQLPLDSQLRNQMANYVSLRNSKLRSWFKNRINKK